jgi:HrpA-like RNA helicase
VTRFPAFIFCREDILVFLTGQDEIETMTQQVRQVSHHDEAAARSPATKLIPLPLYASLQSFSQQVSI